MVEDIVTCMAMILDYKFQTTHGRRHCNMYGYDGMPSWITVKLIILGVHERWARPAPLITPTVSVAFTVVLWFPST